MAMRVFPLRGEDGEALRVEWSKVRAVRLASHSRTRHSRTRGTTKRARRPTPGPLALGRETADRPVQFVSPSQASSLCDQTLDWIEAIRIRRQ